VDYSKPQKSLLQHLANLLLELLAPTFCCNCGKIGLLLCNSCFQKIQYTPFSVNPNSPCQNTEPEISEVYTTAQYRTPINELIKTMKFAGVISVCEYLANLTYYSQKLPKIDILCPVPLHSKRKRERGFDQAEEITKHLAKLYKIPMVQLLERTRHMAAQSSITKKEERLQRLFGSFRVKKKYLLPLQKQTNQISIGLVDDVYTTGATLTACAQALHNVNPQIKIIGICMARD
jgi:ComF family protein